jgi:hypothetical protein
MNTINTINNTESFTPRLNAKINSIYRPIARNFRIRKEKIKNSTIEKIQKKIMDTIDSFV